MLHFAPVTQVPHPNSAPPAPPAAAAGAPPRAAVARFVAVVLGVLTACWAIVAALLAPLVPGGLFAGAAAWAAFTLLPLAVFVLTRWRGVYPGAAVRVLVFRPLWYAQLLVLLLAPAGAAAWLLGWPFHAAAAAGRWAVLAAGALVLVAALAGYAGSRRLQVRRYVAVLPRLPKGLAGITVAQISDLHVGPQTSRRHLATVLAAVRAARADLVTVTGDLVDDFPGDAERYRAALGDLAAPLGVFAVPGNHEVYAGWSELRPRLEALPLTLLVNRAVAVRRNGARLWVAGTGDPAGGPGGAAGPDPARTLAGVPAGDCVLVLAHNPALWPALAERGASLTLSGHTHWGQLGFRPRRGRAGGWCLASPFVELAMGAHARGDALLWIHPGTNYWGVPFRLGHAAEVSVITLQPGEKAEWREGSPE